MNRLIFLLLAMFVMIILFACSSNSNIEQIGFISWSVVEEVGRDGDDVHYRVHLSNGMTVDRYTREENDEKRFV